VSRLISWHGLTWVRVACTGVDFLINPEDVPARFAVAVSVRGKVPHSRHLRVRHVLVGPRPVAGVEPNLMNKWSSVHVYMNKVFL
jgi:hypothetical protein